MTDSTTVQDTPFTTLGGTAAVRRLVEAFYDFMDSDPAYAGLRALHAPDLSPMRVSLAGFLTGWLGGPRDWFEAHRGLCMMSLHRAMPIDAELARQWTDAMARALVQAEIDPEMAKALHETFTRMAGGMTSR